MKMKLFFSVVLVAGVIAALNANAANNKLGDISLKNIEMLSNIESGEDMSCLFTGSLDCPRSGTKVYAIW